MSKEDYYKLLGVEKSVSPEDLKKAYRKMAMKYHPDRNQGNADAEAKFKKISEAYEILQDPQKRAAYDQYGHGAFDGSGGFAGAGGGGFSGGGFSDISDMFEEIFGRGFSGGRRQHSQSDGVNGSDLRYDVSLTLEQAHEGFSDTIHIHKNIKCSDCTGSGAEKGTSPILCSACKGMGTTHFQQGFFTFERTCGKCGGAGKEIKSPCKPCRGTGRIAKQQELKITIPAGVEDGTRLRIANEGEAGARGGSTGDLYLFVSVKPHTLFTRQEADLHCVVPVPMTVAVLGGDVEVPTIDGSRTKITIPAGTQPTEKLRLKGKGMTILRQSRRGDMIIHIMVEIPVKLSSEQIDLIKQFSEVEKKEESNPKTKSFMDKVKEFMSGKK
jgi:molecular chaperone DnaJ